METIVNVALALLGCAVLFAGLTCIVGNYVMLVLSVRNQRRGVKKFYSQVPLVGPILLSILWLNVTVIPGTLIWFLLLSWILDPATWLVVGALLANVRQTDRR